MILCHLLHHSATEFIEEIKKKKIIEIIEKIRDEDKK